MKTFKFYKQLESLDCGPTCLKMIAYFYGRNIDISTIRDRCYASRLGVSLGGINEGAKSFGFQTKPVKISFSQLENNELFPCILHWRQNHYIIVISKKKNGFRVADPGFGIIILSKEDFQQNWINSVSQKGIALLMKPTNAFYSNNQEVKNQSKKELKFIYKYLREHQLLLIQIVLGMLSGALINLLFPIITEQLVDKGIKYKNISLVGGFLLAQIALFIGSTFTDLIRNHVLLFVSTKINTNMISDFLVKLMKLPIYFFDTKIISDLLLRIDDHSKIEEFLTSSSINIIFYSFNFLFFSILLFIYQPLLFIIFIIGSILSVLWIVIFMGKRKIINYKRFDITSSNRDNLYELVTGMSEIKLNNAENYKRFEWQRLQVKLYKLNKKSLSLQQMQRLGMHCITQIKNISITFIAAYFVIKGNISLGILLSTSYIIGQLNNPLEQFIEFFSSLQDAKVSFNRLNDIYSKQDEVALKQGIEFIPDIQLKKANCISIINVAFQYNGPYSQKIFNNLNLEIPLNKITAIVGASGSGKTTLLKLLLKFYRPNEGIIYINGKNLEWENPSYWRSRCGVVMQDGYIFSDSISRNIALSDDILNHERILYASDIANILEFVNSLPQKFNTKIGNSGIGLSIGQKQRILIARAIYKNPDFIFLDEATSSLDANNERGIIEKLNSFFKNKTVIIIAHRLSTVRNADKIVVLEKGNIVEEGTHSYLVQKEAMYYNLVKNQLELGN